MRIQNWKLVLILILVAFLGSIASVGLWELRRPKFVLTGVRITKIEPFRRSMGDLHFSYRGYSVYIEDDSRQIDFSEKYWCDSVQVNDTVNMVVRENMFENKLDGFHIEKIR